MELNLSRYQNFLQQAPFAVYKSDALTQKKFYHPIPASLSPLHISTDQWIALQKDTQAIIESMFKFTHWLRKKEQKNIAHQLYSDLSKIEQQIAFQPQEYADALAIGRVDLFFDPQTQHQDEELKIIEVNCTIPAMAAYSDMVNQGYQAGLGEPQKGGSNSLDLLRSLLDHYQKLGGVKKQLLIALVARKDDSQMAELLWLKKTWESQQHQCVICSPDELGIQESALIFEGQAIDLVYRHIFAASLDEKSAFAQACLKPHRFKILNPISGHMEAKGFISELSRIAQIDQLSISVGLDTKERQAIERRIPWSRLILPRSDTLPNHDHVSDLLQWLKANPQDLVIKHHVGYGGYDVVIGDEFDSKLGQQKIARIMKSSKSVTWSDFIDHCASLRSGLWMVQKRLQGRRQLISYLDSAGKSVQNTCTIDASLFFNYGIDFQMNGATSRFSPGTIVNIAGGGGLMPVLFV